MSSEPIGFALEFRVEEGRFDELEAILEELVENVEAEEERTLVYHWFRARGGDVCTTIQWFPDQDAVIHHLTRPGPEVFLDRMLECCDFQSIHVYGTPGDKLAEVLAEYPITAIHEPVAGFTR